MTIGYEWGIVVRIEPRNDAAEDVDLSSLLTDVGGPLRVRPQWRPRNHYDTTITHRQVQALRGYEVGIRLELFVRTMVDQAATIAKLQRWLNRRDAVVSLSLDGGTTFRAVRLRRWSGPDPAGGKTYVGAEYRIDLDAVDLVEEAEADSAGRIV